MTIQANFAEAPANLGALLDAAVNNREVVIIHRPGEEDAALIAADELAGLLETAHLLRSPANAERLLATLARIREGAGTPQSVEALRREFGLEQG